MDAKPKKCAPFEEREVLHIFGEDSGPKAAAVFNSQSDRFKAKGGVGGPIEVPGPGDYVNSTNEPRYIIKGPTESKFGSNITRNCLIHRDVSKSPFKNPTSLDNPSPAQYAPKTHELSKGLVSPGKTLPAASAGAFLQGSPTGSNNLLMGGSVDFEDGSQLKMTSTFQSHVPRDFLASVSKEQKVNPGPGSYLHDQLMQDKMKALSFQVCQRY